MLIGTLKPHVVQLNHRFAEKIKEKMSKVNFLFLSFLFFACNSNTPSEEIISEEEPMEAPAHNTLTVEEKAAGWQLLFDGSDVSAWRGYNKTGFPERGWKVENGEISCEYSGTD